MMQTFTADTRVQFSVSTEDFRVDTEGRTIAGLILPWGKVSDNNGAGRWRFRRGSVAWSDPRRVKLNLDHDSRSLVGVATRIQDSSRGLVGTFRMARDEDGDRALARASDGILDGFSVEVVFDDPTAWEYSQEDGVKDVVRSTLRAVALTGVPAFDDARLTATRATTSREVTTVPEEDTGAGQMTFDFEQFTTELAAAHRQATEGLIQSIGDSVSQGVRAALENIHDPQNDGPQTVRPARFQVTREAPVYSLDGTGNSIVRDAWYAGREHDHEALERLRKFRVQSEDVAKLARHAVRGAQFATVTTGTASQVIPPGYRPDLFVPMLGQGRPMVNAASQGTIENATPFVVPVFGSFTGTSADHVEGTNPTDGSLTFATRTVTPGAISGKLVLTREIVDSSNPAIDQIAFNAMRESYARQTEGKVYTLVNGANGAGGTITGDFVPSGAQASTIAAGTDSQALVKHIRERLAKYPFNRFASAEMALMGQNATTKLATAVDTTQRPLLPSVAPQNSNGLGNAATQGWSVDGLPFRPAWAMTGVAAGDTQIAILNPSDLWVWESPLLTFRYEEKSGPALIELALFGYFATHLLRPVGLSGIRIT